MKYFKIVFLILLLFTGSAVSQQVNLKVIETSDIHGKIFPFDFTNLEESGGSMAQVYSYVKSEREKKNQKVILLDNGDIFQGSPAVYYYNFEDTSRVHLLSEVMDYMEYDAATVGNHDVETGHNVYDKVIKEMGFPWMAANAVRIDNGKPYFKPYTVFKNDGVKTVVLGMITPHIPHWLPKKLWSGMEFKDMIKSAEYWVREIEQKENPDLLIGLFHAGVNASYGDQSAETPKNENASRLVAEQVPGFDIVFAGHDHQGWNKTVKNSSGEEVVILGPTSKGRDAAAAEIKLVKTPDGKWEKSITPKIVQMENFPPDKNFMEKFAGEYEQIKNYVSKPLGSFTKTISSKKAILGNSAFVDLIHEIQLDISEADISFAAPLSLNAQIDSGKGYVKDMFKLYKYENFLYTMKLSGKEIDNYLEYSYAGWFNTMESKDDHLLNFVKDKDGNLKFSERYNSPMLQERYYNFDNAEGINYVVDISKPEGDKVEITSLSNGKTFNEGETYKVAVNSYRGNGGGGHLVDGAGIPREKLSERLINSTEKDLRFYMMKWIESIQTVTPEETENWKVIPQEWWKEAKERNHELLFDEKP